MFEMFIGVLVFGEDKYKRSTNPMENIARIPSQVCFKLDYYYFSK